MVFNDSTAASPKRVLVVSLREHVSESVEQDQQ